MEEEKKKASGMDVGKSQAVSAWGGNNHGNGTRTGFVGSVALPPSPPPRPGQVSGFRADIHHRRHRGAGSRGAKQQKGGLELGVSSEKCPGWLAGWGCDGMIDGSGLLPLPLLMRLLT